MFCFPRLHHLVSLLPREGPAAKPYFASVCSNTSNGFTFSLGSCSIGDQGCKFLARGLSKSPNSHSEISLYLSNNDFMKKGHTTYIAEVIKNTSSISVLDFVNNAIGNSGLSTLCEALILSTKTSLKSLDLHSCSLTISDDNGAINF